MEMLVMNAGGNIPRESRFETILDYIREKNADSRRKLCRALDMTGLRRRSL
jgi:hypothetical protein